MTWQTNSWILAARSLGRSLGLNRRIAKYLCGPGYETKYLDLFVSNLKMGDCVWDVGANVGYYTKLFSESIGEKGILFAFEPSPVNFSRLSDACASLRNVRPIQIGLGAKDGKLFFRQGTDDLGATSRVVDTGADADRVDIRSGTSLILEDDVLPPNAVKIDVEGYEYEVLQGLGSQLESNDLRIIGIEVHFGILAERGMAQVPNDMEKLLRLHGFSIKWPDNSHMLAIRPNP